MSRNNPKFLVMNQILQNETEIGINKIKSEIERKGLDYVIASLVDSSDGYYSPHIAGITLEKILQDGKSYSERGMCCFHCDGIDEVLHGMRYFEGKESYDPAFVYRMVKYTRINRGDSDFIKNMGFSMMYPTKGV